MIDIRELPRHIGPGLMHLVRRTIARDAQISFSQNGEDMILDAALGHRPSGFYVDVGANHPRLMSNSYRFYLRGWSGVAVDANAEFEPLWRKRRPRDVFVRACVSDEVQTVDFNIFNSRALSSIGGEKFYDNEDHYALVRVDNLETRTLTGILDEAGAPSAFEFLSIDVEGHDFKVIRSLDLDRYSPEVVLIELNGTDFHPDSIGRSEVAQYLARYSYRPQAALHSSVLFRK